MDHNIPFQTVTRTAGLAKQLFAPLRAIGVVRRHPELIRYMIVPWLVTFLFVVAATLLFLFWMPDFVTYIWPTPENYWLSWIHLIVSGLLWVFVSVLVVLVGFLAGQVAAAPAYVTLAEETRRCISGSLPERDGTLFTELVQPVLGESVKLVIFLLLQGGFLLLHLLPGIGSILFVLCSTVTTLFWIALEFFDYALDTEGPLTVVERIRYIFRNKQMTFAFAGGMFFVLSVPLLNVVLAPLGVVGATLLHVEKKNQV